MSIRALGYNAFDVDGNVSKPALLDFVDVVAGFANASASGAVGFASLAEASASLSYPANTLAHVIGDAVASNNGIYRKNGASGAGSWSRLGDLGYQVIALTLTGSSTANALSAVSANPVSPLDRAALVVFQIALANTDAVTLAVNGEAPLPLVDELGAALPAGYLVPGSLQIATRHGGAWRLFLPINARRAVRTPPGEVIADLPDAAMRAGRLLAFDALGAPVTVPQTLNPTAVLSAQISDSTAAGRLLLAAADAAAQRVALNVRAITDPISVTATGTATARVLADREADALNVLDFGADPSGVGSSSAAFAAALAQANTRNGRVLIDLPGGVYRLTEQLVLALASGKPIALRGAGREATRIVVAHTGSWLRIGRPYDESSPFLTENVTLQDMTWVGNETSLTDYAVWITNADDVTLSRVTFDQVPGRTFRLGKARPTLERDDVKRVHLQSLRVIVQPGVTAEMIELVSGSILTIDGASKVDGSTSAGAGQTPFMLQSSASTRNWDGIRLHGVVCEGVSQFLGVYGQGISNLEASGCIADRVTAHHIETGLASGGLNKDWLLAMTFQGRAVGEGGANTISAIRLANGAAAAGAHQGIKIVGSSFFDCGGRPLWSDGGCGIVFASNTIRACGFSGTPLITATTADKIAIVGNVAETAGRAGYTHGVEWAGTPNAAERKSSANVWSGRATADEVGTA